MQPCFIACFYVQAMGELGFGHSLKDHIDLHVLRNLGRQPLDHITLTMGKHAATCQAAGHRESYTGIFQF